MKLFRSRGGGKLCKPLDFGLLKLGLIPSSPEATPRQVPASPEATQDKLGLNWLCFGILLALIGFELALIGFELALFS
jgi:hypothetical protein